MTTRITPDELQAWRDHIGRREVRLQVLDADLLRRFAAATGAKLEVEREAPPLAHWAYFLDVVGSDKLGPDGHPKRGAGLLPPVSLPRRMFAAGSIEFLTPLMLGEPAEMTLVVADVRHRPGASGDLVFVDVERRIVQHAAERVLERQTLVYRDAVQRTPAVHPVASGELPPGESWRPEALDLFRFSAVTFNAHRIHYDLPYAQDQEGYPQLVVHGPFTAVKLATLAAKRRPEAPMRSFTFRATAPLFAGQPVRLTDGDGEGEGEFRAVRCDGSIAMTAQAGF